MKKCLKCGKIEQSNNFSLCSICGGSLIKVENFLESEGAHSVTEGKNGKKKNVYIVLLMIALVISVALCCFFASQLYGRKTETSKETAPIKTNEKMFEEKPAETENNDASETQVKMENIISNEIIPDDFDVEAEVKRIREVQTGVEKSELKNFTECETAKAFYDADGNIVKITAKPDENFGCVRQYYFENGELYFAFAFIGANIENRLYFYSGNLFRWIDGPQGEQKFHDLEFDNPEFKNWEKRVKEDANHKYSMFL